MLAEYRGTRVAVKKAIQNESFDDYESGFVTASMSKLPSMSKLGTSGKSSNRGMLRKQFIEEIRVMSTLRHPCITTGTCGTALSWPSENVLLFPVLSISPLIDNAVMGAVVEKGKEALLLMEYMEKGSLYDILQNQTTMLEKDLLLPLLQDIISGIVFLHSAVPPVVHGDLKAKNILVNKNFRAKVSSL